MKRIAMVWMALWLMAGCEAQFQDLSPDKSTGQPQDPFADVGSGDSGQPMSDADTSDTSRSDAPKTDKTVARGQFKSLDYDGQGTASLVRLADGGWELRFGDDFEVESVPGPVVVLAKEKTLGSTIDSERGDVELAVLESNSGAMRFELPFPPGPRRVAFIYCKPFGLEVIRADMEDL